MDRYNDVASVLQSVWTAARSNLRSMLEQVTIADLAASGAHWLSLIL